MPPITVDHAVYGSSGGLGDYRILATSSGFDDRAREVLNLSASLGGAALDAPFSPIFSFLIVDPERRIFTRTLFLAPTSRGSDYLVHAIVLDAVALARVRHRVFALEDAQLFIGVKPTLGSELPQLDIAALRVRPTPREGIETAHVAACLRALAKGAARVRLNDAAYAVGLCRAMLETLPPEDRLRTSFCTRLSYGRSLPFRFAAYTPTDAALVREHAARNAVFLDLTSAAPVAPPDLYDRWCTEVGDSTDGELLGLSLLSGPAEAFTLLDSVRTLRRAATGDLLLPGGELAALHAAAGVILHPRNRPLAAPALKTLATAVQLCQCAREAFDNGTSFDGCARIADLLEPDERQDAVRVLREMKPAPDQCWLAEVLLLLPDADSSVILECLRRRRAGDRLNLTRLHAQHASGYEAFIRTVLGRLRDRFGPAGASIAATLALEFSGDRSTQLFFVTLMEATAADDVDRPRQVAWLLAIVRNVVRPASLPPQVAVRIMLVHRLLSEFQDFDELVPLASTLFAMEGRLAAALIDTPPLAVYRVLVYAARRRLAGSMPFTPEGLGLLDRICRGAASALPDANQTQLAVDLTAVVYLATTVLQGVARVQLSAALLASVDALARSALTEPQAMLLVRTLQRLSRSDSAGVSVRARTLTAIARAGWRARSSGPHWNPWRWHLRMQAFSRATA